MVNEVRHLLDQANPYPLIWLAGVLDADSAPAVRSLLLDLLGGQPEAVVVDVGELRVGEPTAMSMLREVHEVTADWPAAHLALCGAAAGSDWHRTGWPIWPDYRAAVANFGAPDTGHRLSHEFEPELGAARSARELITETCGRWDRPDVASPACVVATELVNNVIAHAHTPMTMLLATHGAGISVAVRDRSEVVPTFAGAAPAPTQYGGRGMLLVDSMAKRWGSLTLTDGKVVWALVESDADA